MDQGQPMVDRAQNNEPSTQPLAGEAQNNLGDTRAQPWRKFLKEPSACVVTTFGKDDNIRMIQNRVDGKNLGG
ncbi:hypothetical protein O1611_g3514 [Lasiodiplodia mahajangana]|uniref:Uncharacterized protein n=1 Tax=Lasiodiplodia mahajangana TaxID=1108764 RepID=A0ACC2JRJ5_9PEZI|nr:hypothetical protein O1611_g3514 [Lasiodiplodia mahajangana]